MVVAPAPIRRQASAADAAPRRRVASSRADHLRTPPHGPPLPMTIATPHPGPGSSRGADPTGRADRWRSHGRWCGGPIRGCAPDRDQPPDGSDPLTSLPLIRTEYMNVSTGTVRGGSTGHGESLTDMESYLLPAAQIVASSLHTFGVADGLLVNATSGGTGLTISPGSALDSAGHLITVAVGGFVVTDPSVDPSQIVNVPTVAVGAGGVVLDTTGLTGDLVLTVTWREVLEGQLANTPVLVHAPWVRLLGAADVPADGSQVIL